MTLRVRALSEEEAHRLARMTRSQKLGAGLVRRAQIIQHAVDGLSAPGIAARMGPVRRHGALLAQALQRARSTRSGGGDALGAAADLHRRGAQRGYRRGAVAARRVGPAVCVVDPGPPGGLLGREGHWHEAQPDERGPAGRGAEVAPGRDLVRDAGGPGVRA